jgi:hypothetical protein
VDAVEPDRPVILVVAMLLARAAVLRSWVFHVSGVVGGVVMRGAMSAASQYRRTGIGRSESASRMIRLQRSAPIRNGKCNFPPRFVVALPRWRRPVRMRLPVFHNLATRERSQKPQQFLSVCGERSRMNACQSDFFD